MEDETTYDPDHLIRTEFNESLITFLERCQAQIERMHLIPTIDLLVKILREGQNELDRLRDAERHH